MSVRFSNSVRAQDSLNFVMEWTHALNGNNAISKTLDRLMRLVNADAALISRTIKANRKIRHIARCYMQEGKIWPSQPQTQAEMVLGDCIATAKTGSIWKLSDMVASDSPPMPDIRDRAQNELAEVVVVPLETNGVHVDHLELHFRHSPQSHNLDLLTIMAPTLASGWGRRIPGSVSAKSENIRHHLLSDIHSNGYIPILDPQNPAELSRCEFRVCAMMKEGMTVKLISETLSVGPATVRSHLSSIFSKTGASNQVELLHLLNRKTETGNGFERAVGGRS